MLKLKHKMDSAERKFDIMYVCKMEISHLSMASSLCANIFKDTIDKIIMIYY